MTTLAKGTRVLIKTTNGGRVEGTLLNDASLDYGSTYPIVETDDGYTYNYQHSIATRGDYHACPIAGLASMEPIATVKFRTARRLRDGWTVRVDDGILPDGWEWIA